jgi:hypothetical protein
MDVPFLSENSGLKRRKHLLLPTSIADPDPYFLGLPDPDPLVRGGDPAPDSIMQK